MLRDSKRKWTPSPVTITTLVQLKNETNKLNFFVDSEKNLYVSDWANGQILKFASSNYIDFKFIAVQLNHPEGIWVGYEENLYVADTGNNRIQKFDLNNGKRTTFAAELKQPVQVIVDSDLSVYVLETGNHRVQRYTENSHGVTIAGGTTGNGSDQLNSPHGMAFDSSGYLYVVDTLNNRLQKFDHPGTDACSKDRYDFIRRTAEEEEN
ncbi:unnamed protein product [Didymodactylos carnosus]|uniref:NHL repeat-containing protein n=1 Tax=Didymodactylos carnosus TaxID=1234261 RepID=A0A8S2DLT6_9BILA|nr:unnamed protein product [Didymodactylos carnosus]CAF3705056.1 unnamed protein product [Didymodactylos carnosus]